MSKVWRKLNRVGKKATKYKFTTHSHVLTIFSTAKWQPDKVRITWQRHNRKVSSKFSQWEPSLQNPYEGNVYWEKASDYIEFDVSLYRGINDDEFEEKDWDLFIENEDAKGKRRVLATGKFNMNDYASIDPLFQTDIRNLKLKTMSTKINAASISFSLMCQFLKEGKATDDDMISIASYMSTTSTNNPYLNSNIMFQKNRLSKYSDHDNDLREADFGEADEPIEILVNGNDNSKDDIEYYIKLKDQKANDNFNNISRNFGGGNEIKLEENQVQQVTGDFLKKFDMMAMNEEQDSTFKKTPVKATKPKLSDLKNPFENIDSPDQNLNSNPFENNDDKNTLNEEDRSNPFLSPTLTKSIDSKDLTNPFTETYDQNPSEKLSAPIRILDNTKPITPNQSGETNRLKSEDKKKLILPNMDLSDTGRDLLDWCRNIVKSYHASVYIPAIKPFDTVFINDFTKSWQNGLAFCAIIYRFRPNLISLKELSELDAKKNFNQVFKATDKEKISRVIDFSDFMNKEKLDQLLIMTFLFQLRDHFEASKESKSQSILSPSKSSTSSILSPFKSLDKKKIQKKEKEGSPVKTNTSTPIKSNTENFTINKSKNYSNPFDSDPDEADEDKNTGHRIEILNESEVKTESQLFKTDFQALSFSPSCTSDRSRENKSEELIHKAKIQMERNNSMTKTEEISEKVKSIIKKRRKSSMPKGASMNQSMDKEENQSMMSTSASIIGTEYVNQEILNFKNEQKELDEHAAYLEEKLRSLMKSGKDKSEKDKELEDKLLKEWFLLINRKNALLIRQQELEIIQNEKNLEKRYELLSEKLRDLISIDEFYKTDEQKTAESILLNELISNVMERNDLVLQMDEENKMLNEGELIDEFIQNKSSFQHDQKSCVIQ